MPGLSLLYFMESSVNYVTCSFANTSLPSCPSMLRRHTSRSKGTGSECAHVGSFWCMVTACSEVQTCFFHVLGCPVASVLAQEQLNASDESAICDSLGYFSSLKCMDEKILVFTLSSAKYFLTPMFWHVRLFIYLRQGLLE